MASELAAMTKLARTQITRRPIDSSLLNVSVNGSVVYITGVLRKLRTHPDVNLEEEKGHIAASLRQRLGVHEVVWDVTLRV